MGTDVLLVEDEQELADAICEYLRAHGLTVTHAATAGAAEPLLTSSDLVLLDITLPDGSGFELCRTVRATSQIPVLIMSARSGDDDQVLGLTLGADDYLIKPFSLAVLHARVKRALSRTAAPSAAFDDGRLRVDPDAGRTWLNGQEVAMPTLEARLLHHLVTHRGRVVGKQELFDEVWHETFISEGTLPVHIRRLRQRVEADPDQPRYIRTVWGRGYLFEGEP